jgi:putative metallohydrolase (TIGR04338 family)
MRGGNMPKVKDQAGKLYVAETISGVKQCKGTMTLKECQAFTNKVLARKYVKDTYGSISSITVLDGRGRRRACATYLYGKRVIKLPLWSRNEYVILHEIAHHLTRLDGHKAEFASCLLDLVRHFLGKDSADALQGAYHFKGVKVVGKNGAVKARCPESRKQWVIDEKANLVALKERLKAA